MVILKDGTVFKTHNPDEAGLVEYKLKVQMTQPMCAVLDTKTQLFDPPFVVRHTGEAIREIEIVRKNTETKFGKNPEDFQLYQIATYNYETGVVQPLAEKIFLV